MSSSSIFMILVAFMFVSAWCCETYSDHIKSNERIELAKIASTKEVKQ